MARCDLHLHSSASANKDLPITRHFGCPESYADPLRQYELCKARGMQWVTLTDHDTIDGGLRLLDRPDFFLSEEVTARFPETSSIVHVLAWNIDEPQHRRIQQLRGDVYRLVDFLRAEDIAHGLAHPLDSPDFQLNAATLEKLTLLFSTFEVVNGRAEERLNQGIDRLLTRLDPKALRELSLRHDLQPAGGGQRRVGRCAGSDDHELRRAAACYTEVDDDQTVEGFLREVMAGKARVVGRGADVDNLGLAFAHTTYAFLGALAQDGSPLESPFADLMRALSGRLDLDQAQSAGQREFMAHLQSVTETLVDARPELDLQHVGEGSREGAGAALFEAQIAVADRLLGSAIENLIKSVMNADFFGIFAALRDSAGALKSMVPYLFAADHLGRQLEQLRRVQGQWSVTDWPTDTECLALFSDTLSQVDGVSVWCRRFLLEAKQQGKQVRVPHCGALSNAVCDEQTIEYFVELPEMASAEVPFYEGLRFSVPSLVHTLCFLQKSGATHVELATPGPAAWVGLLAAKLLRLPVRATYHTEVPFLVGTLTQSPRLEAWAAQFVRVFYGLVDGVRVLSEGARERLLALGVPAAKIELAAVAVDPADFSPAHAESSPGERPIVLSVGRLSKEKNLPLLIDAMARLHDLQPRPLLLIAGEGPERASMEELCRGREDVRLLGHQSGHDLRTLYANASAFVFASEIDTLGLVAMEAMASGTPVLVPRVAAISAIVEHRRSAYCFELNPVALAAALRDVLGDPALSASLRTNARQTMVARWRTLRGEPTELLPIAS